MLDAFHGQWHLENQVSFTAHTLAELNNLVKQLAAAPSVSSYRTGASGHHGWIIVTNHEFNLEIYFGESTGKDAVVSFVLYGPYTPEDAGSIFDGRGLSGEMTTDRVCELLAILDEKKSPLAFVHQSALEVAVVTD